MDEMQPEQEQGVGADEVIIELLTELVQQGRSKRAESVMAPPPAEAPPVEGGDAEMAELEAMLGAAPEGAEMPPEIPLEEAACPKCGKSPCEC